MPLQIRDGNQSLTTLSTLIVNSAHVPAHTVVSLGSQAITDIAQAVSGVELGPNTINALENISVTFGAGTSITIGNIVSVTGGLTNTELRASAVTVGGNVTATISGTPSVTFSSIQVSNFPSNQTVTFGVASVTFSNPTITGSVSVLNFPASQTVTFSQAAVTFGAVTASVSVLNFPASQSVTFGTAVVTGSTSIIGTPSVTFGLISGTVTANLPSVPTHGVTIANSSVTVNGTFWQATQPVSLASLPSLTAGTSQIGSVTATISGTPSVTFSSIQISNFPVTQTTTFGAITGSVSVLNLPATQAVTFSSVQISNFPATQVVTGTVELGPNSLTALENITVTLGQVTITGGLTNAELRASSVTVGGSVQVSNFPATQSVTFSNPTITGSVSILNLPATQAVTFTQASITFSSITGSVSVLNFPATQTTTFSAITGSVSVLNLPATQTVTFTQASVTFGTPVVTGSVSVLNFPSTQTIAGTVTANVPIISNFIAEGGGPTGTLGVQIAYETDQSDPGLSYIVSETQRLPVALSSLPAISGTVTANVAGNLNGTIENYDTDGTATHKVAVQIYDPNGQALGGGAPLPISGTVTVGNSVTIGSLPAISGTVTANSGNLINSEGSYIAKDSATNLLLLGGIQYAATPTQSRIDALETDGTGKLNTNAYLLWTDTNAGSQPRYASQQAPLPVQVLGGSVTIGSLPAISGTVTANLSSSNLNSVTIGIRGTVTVGNSITIGSIPAISGTVTANVLGYDPYNGAYPQIPVHPAIEGFSSNDEAIPVIIGTDLGVINSISNRLPISGTVTVGNSVTIGSLPAISGTVTASISTFPRPTWTDYSGTVVTANSAVTAISTVTRSYLLAQVTTGQMFLNIGATATTLNSVYFSAGQGFAWETSVPQGLVSIISAVTGTNYVLKDG